MSEFGGLYIPLVTPFDPVTGEVALVHFRNNMRKWLEEPIDGFVLFGSTGEGVLVDDDEKSSLIEHARELIPAGKKLVVGITADATRAIVKKAQRFAQAGADAFLVAPPPYFGAYLGASALADHYRAVADGAPAPILIYHIPKYTKVVLEPGLMGELVRHGNIAGLKDSSGDLKRFADYTTACSGSALFVGNGTLLYSALELGASGGIVAIGQLAPRLCGELVQAFRAGNAQRAGELQERATPLHREIVASHGAIGVKAALDLLAGYYGGPPRRPLVPLSAKERQPLARVMQETGLLQSSMAMN